MMRRLAALFIGLMLGAPLANAQMLVTGAGPGARSSGTCDPNFAAVVLLVGNDNAASGATTFLDQSNNAKTVSIANGSPVYTNATAPTGMTTSINLPGSGASHAVLSAANSVDFRFGAGDFVIEAYVNQTSGGYFTSTMPNGSVVDEWLISPNLISSGIQLGWGQDSATWAVIGTASGGGATTGVWTHIAMYRVGNQMYGAINGTVTNVGSSAAALVATTQPISIGAISDLTSTFIGQFASMRITKGVARYGASNFTPPSLPLPHC